MRAGLRDIGTALKCAAINTINHDGIEHAGYLAFLGLLALFPFMVFLVAMIGVLGQGQTGAALVSSVLEVLPQAVTTAVKPRVVEIISGPPEGLLTFSVLGAVWTASSAVEGIRTVLNRAYHVQAPPAYILRRLLSIAQLLFFTFVAIAAMLAAVAAQLVLRTLDEWLAAHVPKPLMEQAHNLVFLALPSAMWFAVSAMYYTIPNIKQQLAAVLPGALLVVLGWWAGAWALAYYLSHFNQFNLIYGGLGGIIAALIFFYVSNIIFIYGAEFNYLLSQKLGLRMQKTSDATEVPGP